MQAPRANSSVSSSVFTLHKPLSRHCDALLQQWLAAALGLQGTLLCATFPAGKKQVPGVSEFCAATKEEAASRTRSFMLSERIGVGQRAGDVVLWLRWKVWQLWQILGIGMKIMTSHNLVATISREATSCHRIEKSRWYPILNITNIDRGVEESTASHPKSQRHKGLPLYHLPFIAPYSFSTIALKTTRRNQQLVLQKLWKEGTQASSGDLLGPKRSPSTTTAPGKRHGFDWTIVTEGSEALTRLRGADPFDASYTSCQASGSRERDGLGTGQLLEVAVRK